MDARAAVAAAQAARAADQPAVEPFDSSYAVLDRYTDPVFVIDVERRIYFKNAAADAVLKTKASLLQHRGRLVLAASQADNQLRSVVSDELSWKRSAACRGFRLPRRGASKAWLVLVSPLRAHEGPRRTSRRFLVQLVGRVYPRSLPATALRDLFDLSRRELDAIAGIMTHESLRAVAFSMRVSLETVRSHLKRIFRKCDVRSRTELVAMLQRICLFVPAAGAS